jgi:hypothetical protein
MTQTPIYITWLNNKGGFDYFFFKAKNMYQVDVEDAGVTRNNILPQWPKSYGNTADTINRQTYSVTRNVINLRSQHLNLNQVNALAVIKSSPLVQIVYSRTDRRTVLVDTNSFKKYDEMERGLFTLQFTLNYTDEIPTQRI